MLLRDLALEESQSIFNYFDDTYVGRLTSQGQKKLRFDNTAIEFPLKKNNDERPLTNNAVEGWNNFFVKLVKSKHPLIPNFLENPDPRKTNTKTSKSK